MARIGWGRRGDKWLMLYTCGDTPRDKYDPNNREHYNPNNRRGVHLRAADTPRGSLVTPGAGVQLEVAGGRLLSFYARPGARTGMQPEPSRWIVENAEKSECVRSERSAHVRR